MRRARGVKAAVADEKGGGEAKRPGRPAGVVCLT